MGQSLGIVSSMTLTAIHSNIGHFYAATETKVKNSEELIPFVMNEFGPDAKIADWSDLKANPGTKKECVAFLDAVGNPWVQFNGEEFWGPNCRRYFFERHNGSVPIGWLDHDNLHDHLVDLGSWFDHHRKVLVDLGEY